MLHFHRWSMWTRDTTITEVFYEYSDTLPIRTEMTQYRTCEICGLTKTKKLVIR